MILLFQRHCTYVLDLSIEQGSSPHAEHTVSALYLKHIHCSAALAETLFWIVQKGLFLIQTVSQSNKSSPTIISHTVYPNWIGNLTLFKTRYSAGKIVLVIG